MRFVRIMMFVRRRDLHVVIGDFDFLRPSHLAIAIAIRMSDPLCAAARICMYRGTSA
jgi:hypothetical protein